jgi:hypothetical protein
VATGKINTPELAEEVLRQEHADLVGIARPLLADPDWPRKVQAGQFDRVIRCCYANVCKAKDERFQTVTCFLWPKGSRQAPESGDTIAPKWPAAGAALTADGSKGRIDLHWSAATDNEAVYGYDIWRAVDDGEFERIDAVPAAVTSYHDSTAVSGLNYRYYVRAYDFAGHRTPPSATLAARLP